MKYIPKLPDSSVNVTKENVLLKSLKLLSVLVFLGFILYMGMQKTLDLLVDNITPAQEKRLAKMMHSSISLDKEVKSAYLQSVVDKLALCAKLPYKIDIYIFESEEINAFALPSGKIYITRGMLGCLENENELINVIGHEMGHFKHKDHLKGLGNSLILAMMSLFLEGHYGSFFESSLKLSQAKYSQSAEYQADAFGLDVMACTYGDVTSATTLFDRMDDGKKWSYFLESHPDFSSRVKRMKEQIREKGYLEKGEIRPLKKILD